MDQHTVAEVLDRTAGALIDLAYELRELCPDRAGVAERATDAQRLEIVKRISAFWNGVKLSPVLDVEDVTVDLTSAQGRWELLVLALLRAARVNEAVANRTFATLKREELLCLRELSAESTALRMRIDAVFESRYRALGRREDKVNALFKNAKLLVDRWDGDLSNLYVAAGDDRELIRLLQEFHQVKRIALWVVRTLRVHGVWVDAGVSASAYMDRWVRLPESRLGLSDAPHGGDERSAPIQTELTAAMVNELFNGDVLPVFLQGYSLCAQNDPEVCLAECPVASWCSFPRIDSQSEAELK